MSFSMDQLRSLGRDLAMVSQASLSSTSSSKEFLDLVKAIGESKSKAEEDRIMASEIEHLKTSLTAPDVTRRKMKEYIVRLIYVDILGHDASFGYINAVKMTHDDNLLFKRTGYLACTLFLDDNHDLIILIVNTLQKDLKSDNHLVVCAALGAVCKLINEETIPAVLQQVVDLVSHPKELVRKKAVMALHRFHQRSPSSVSHVVGKFKEALCDKDPSVMGASLCAFQDLVPVDIEAYRPLVPSFLSILKQIVDGRLPSTFNYHKTPAPFLQIKILKILALLGSGDSAASELIYPALTDIMKRGDSKTNIGNAILYESVCTAANIMPNNQLLVLCAEVTSKFLKSENHNLKYMGIDALSRIVKINASFANEHQLAVIDCLEDPDDTLKRKTLDLLYKMTSPNNVEIIAEKMLSYLREEQQRLQSALQSRGKTEIASRVIELAERFAPSNHWYIETMNTVFEVAGDVVRPQVAHDLMRLIAEGGSGGDDEEDGADARLRASAVDSYVRLVEEPNLPPLMLQVISWVLGEYATADGHMSAEDVLAKLGDIANSHATDDSVRAYVITAMSKVVSYELAKKGTARLTPEASTFVDDMAASQSTDLQQRAYELRALLTLPRATAAAVMPEDASCEDIEVDKDLSFLDAFVLQSIEKGAAPYRDPADRGMGLSDGMSALALTQGPSHSAHDHPAKGGLRFEAYEQPKVPSAPVLALMGAGPSEPHSYGQQPRRPPAPDPSPYGMPAHLGTPAQDRPGGDVPALGVGDTRLKLQGVQRKWGRPSQPAAPALDPELEAGIAASTAYAANGSVHEQGPPPSQALSSRPQLAAEPVISEEKAKMAAALFGRGGLGGGASGTLSKSRAGMGSRSKPGGQRNAEVPKPAASVPPPAPAVVADLLDFSDSPVTSSAPAAAAAAAVDPFAVLADLEVPAAQPVPVAPQRVPSTNGSSSSSSGDAVVELLGGMASTKGAVGGTSSAGNGSAKFGGAPKLPNAVQRDATARTVGVASAAMGANAELFKDILS